MTLIEIGFYILIVVSLLGFVLLFVAPIYIVVLRKFLGNKDIVREKYSFGFWPTDIALYGANLMIASATVAGLLYSISIDGDIHRPYLSAAPAFVRSDPESNSKLVIELENVGSRPASDILIIGGYMSDAKGLPVLLDTILETGNDVPQGSKPKMLIDYHKFDFGFAMEKTRRFLVVRLCYKNTFNGDLHDETRYAMWPGAENVLVGKEFDRLSWAFVTDATERAGLEISFQDYLRSQSDEMKERILEKC